LLLRFQKTAAITIGKSEANPVKDQIPSLKILGVETSDKM
jgi:hypothetical protein